MNNFETLWQPGTDHAGIATQALVEKLETKVSRKTILVEKILLKKYGIGKINMVILYQPIKIPVVHG